MKRKRNAMVDTDGRLLKRSVAPSSQHNSQGGIGLLRASREHWPTLQCCLAVSVYAGPRVANASAIVVELVSAVPGQKGSSVELRR